LESALLLRNIGKKTPIIFCGIFLKKTTISGISANNNQQRQREEALLPSVSRSLVSWMRPNFSKRFVETVDTPMHRRSLATAAEANA
jgi:hypothetical protein